MGIIDAIRGAYEGAFADSWLEVITIDEYRQGQLVAIGHPLRSKRSSNTSGTKDVITDGSKVFLAYSETALTVENGEITNIYDTPGEHKFHSELTKGFFSGGSITEGLKNINEDAKDRVTFGGDKAVVQKVYYINQREQMGNKFASSQGIPVRIHVPDLNYDVDCTCTLSGAYSFKIVDAIAFYKNFVGNIAKPYYSDPIVGLINSYIMTSVQTAIANLFANGTRPSGMVGYVESLAAQLCDVTTEQLGKERGLALISCGIDKFTLSGNDLHFLQEIERDKVLTDPSMAAATLVGAVADAIQTIAYDAEAARGPWGYGRIGVALMEKRKAEGYVERPKRRRTWRCKCGTYVQGNYCTKCGQKELFVCDECGAEGSGKYCEMCGYEIKRY